MKRIEFLKALLAAPSAVAASQVLNERPRPQKDVQTVQEVWVNNDNEAVFGYSTTGETWIMYDSEGNAWERNGSPVQATRTF